MTLYFVGHTTLRRKLLNIFFIFLLLLASPIASAEDSQEEQILDDIVAYTVESVHADATAFFRTWINPKLEESLSRTHLDDSGIEAIYEQFKDTVVTIPSPGSREQSEAVYGQDRWVKIYQFGMIINSMLIYLPEEEIEKYGALLWAMRDTLYIDLQYVAWGIEGNFARDVYFYELHTAWLQNAEDAYTTLLVGDTEVR
jgi:hypothetical protein